MTAVRRASVDEEVPGQEVAVHPHGAPDHSGAASACSHAPFARAVSIVPSSWDRPRASLVLRRERPPAPALRSSRSIARSAR
jgi:hypothetical protein